MKKVILVSVLGFVSVNFSYGAEPSLAELGCQESMDKITSMHQLGPVNFERFFDLSAAQKQLRAADDGYIKAQDALNGDRKQKLASYEELAGKARSKAEEAEFSRLEQETYEARKYQYGVLTDAPQDSEAVAKLNYARGVDEFRKANSLGLMNGDADWDNLAKKADYISQYGTGRNDVRVYVSRLKGKVTHISVSVAGEDKEDKSMRTVFTTYKIKPGCKIDNSEILFGKTRDGFPHTDTVTQKQCNDDKWKKLVPSLPLAKDFEKWQCHKVGGNFGSLYDKLAGDGLQGCRCGILQKFKLIFPLQEGCSGMPAFKNEVENRVREMGGSSWSMESREGATAVIDACRKNKTLFDEPAAQVSKVKNSSPGTREEGLGSTAE
jgi:hypothetical protein